MHHIMQIAPTTGKLMEFSLSALFVGIGGAVGGIWLFCSTSESPIADGKCDIAGGGPEGEPTCGLDLRELEGMSVLELL